MAENYVNYDDDNFEDLEELMGNTDLENVTQTSGDSNFAPLPDGYYLCVVEKAALKRSKDGKAMVAFTFKTIANGIITTEPDENGDTYFTRVPHTTNRKVFKNWIIDDKVKLEKFASNMLKFEGEELGVPLLEKECFKQVALLREALAVLVDLGIYVNVKNSEKDGQTNTWVNLIDWTRASEFELDSVPDVE